MDTRIRLAVYVSIGVLLLGTAVAGARGVGNIVSQKIVEITPYDVKVQDAVAAPDGARQDDGAEMLVYNRNLFNQKGGAGEPEVEEEPVDEEEPLIEEIASDGTRPVLTDLRVLLKGTQVASDPAYSLAMMMPLDNGNDARMMYLSEGSEVLEEARIVKIVRNRVYMTRMTAGDRLEYLDIRTTEEDLADAKKSMERVAEKEKAAQTAKERAAEKAERDRNNAAAASAELVRKLGNDTYEVSREVVEAIRKNPNALKNSAKYGKMPQVQPVYRGGNIGGFRLLGIENDSVYAKLGLKSGDTIIDVNGQTIDGPQKAMALFDALKPDQNVGIRINRAGQEKTLTFNFK